MSPDRHPEGQDAGDPEDRSANPGLDEERRLPSVSLAEVLAACRDLAAEGLPVTRRSVRERLGRGSMTTIHNGVSQFESQLAPEAPRLDLTAADREVISDLGVRALAVAEERVHNILAEREAALRLQIEAAETRAADAIATAESLIAEAQRRALEAEAARDAAQIGRDAATAAAEEAGRHALRLDGQTTQLANDKAAAEARRADIEAELATVKTRVEVEAAGREHAEANARATATELAGLRAEYAARKQEDADALSRARENLAVEQARLAEMTRHREAAREAVQGKETELARRAADLSAAASALARAEATIAARDETIVRLSTSLATEQAQTRGLTMALVEGGKHTKALLSLQETFSSSMAAVENRLDTRIESLQRELTEGRDDEAAPVSG